MKILIANTYYYPEIEGGAEYSVKMLAEQLNQMNNEVYILCTGDNEIQERINGVNIIRFKPRCLVRIKHCYTKNSAIRKIHRVLDIFNPFNLATFTKVIEQVQPDIIHSNGLYDITPSLWLAAKKYSIPVVHTLRDYYLMCEHSNLMVKDTCECCVNPSILCQLYRKINYLSLKLVNVVTSPSEITLQIALKSKMFPYSKGTVIPNAIPFEQQKVEEIISKRLNNKDRRYTTFIFLGTLSEFKGIKWLMKCFSSVNLQNIRLWIAGKGELEQEVLKYTEIDNRIEFKGFLNQNEVSDLLHKCDILICPSLWNEPFGRVILDAYKSGMPVIATVSGALQEIVENNRTGILVSPNSDSELIQAISLFSLDKEFYNLCCINIRNYIKKYSIEYQAEMFLELYKKSIKDK